MGARPLRRTIQREIEDQLSEKILFGEIGAGEIITVDVEGWDGESKDNTGAKFTFSPRPKPLPEDTEEPQLDGAEVRENDADSTDAGEPDTITPDVPGDGGSTAAGTDLESGSDSDDDGHNPPPAGAGQPM